MALGALGGVDAAKYGGPAGCSAAGTAAVVGGAAGLGAGGGAPEQCLGSLGSAAVATSSKWWIGCRKQWIVRREKQQAMPRLVAGAAGEDSEVVHQAVVAVAVAVESRRATRGAHQLLRLRLTRDIPSPVRELGRRTRSCWRRTAWVEAGTCLVESSLGAGRRYWRGVGEGVGEGKGKGNGKKVRPGRGGGRRGDGAEGCSFERKREGSGERTR